MLDTDTKRRIDTARDILVGKVPDPKSQVPLCHGRSRRTGQLPVALLDPADQIREVLIHENYLSQKDIEICLGFDVESLKDHEGVDEIRALHRAFTTEYKTDDPSGAA